MRPTIEEKFTARLFKETVEVSALFDVVFKDNTTKESIEQYISTKYGLENMQAFVNKLFLVSQLPEWDAHASSTGDEGIIEIRKEVLLDWAGDDPEKLDSVNKVIEEDLDELG